MSEAEKVFQEAMGIWVKNLAKALRLDSSIRDKVVDHIWECRPKQQLDGGNIRYAPADQSPFFDQKSL